MLQNSRFTQYVSLLLLIAVVYLALWFTNRIFKKFKKSVLKSFKNDPHEFKLHSFKLTSPRSILKVFLTLLEILYIITNLAIVLFSIPFFLSLFPKSSSLSKQITGLIWSPIKKMGVEILGYAPNFFNILIIVIFSYYLSRVVKAVLKGVEQNNISIPGFYAEWANPTSRILSFLIWVLTAARVVPLLPGAGSSEFKGVTLVLTGLFSLGSASSIANITSGFLLHYLRSLKLGDCVKIQDTVGEVVEMGLLVTRVKNYQNLITAIPNAEILKSNVSNFTRSIGKEELAIPVGLSIGYEVPCSEVQNFLKSAAQEVEGVKKHPEPYVLQKKLNDFYISYELNFYPKSTDGLAKTTSKVLESIQNESVKRNIQILSPHYKTVDILK